MEPPTLASTEFFLEQLDVLKVLDPTVRPPLARSPLTQCAPHRTGADVLAGCY